MAQTTDGITFVNARAEYSVDDGSTWVDFSGQLTTLEVGGGEREIGSAYTADGDYPIVGIGKQALVELTIKTVYSEISSEMTEILENAYQNQTKIRVRWANKGMASGYRLYTSDAGYIVSPPWVGGDAGSADILMNEWVLHTPRIIPSTQA